MTEDRKPILAIAQVERIIRNSGNNIRVSEDAAIELAKTLETYGSAAAKEAITLANHAGRTTVRAEDIRLAVSRLWVEYKY